MAPLDTKGYPIFDIGLEIEAHDPRGSTAR